MPTSQTADLARGKEFAYLAQLDGLRACAILGVFLFHSPLHLKGGWMGVDLFFVLSGFLITRILLSQRDKPIKQYFVPSTTAELGAFRRRMPSHLLRVLPYSALRG